MTFQKVAVVFGGVAALEFARNPMRAVIRARSSTLLRRTSNPAFFMASAQ
jgi:hypothetical protein